MEIKIKRGRDNDYYWAEIEVCGDDAKGFYPFVLSEEYPDVDVDIRNKSDLDELINRLYDVNNDDFRVCGNKIKLLGRSMITVQKAVEYIIEWVQWNGERFLQCKKMWDSGEEEVIKIN